MDYSFNYERATQTLYVDISSEQSLFGEFVACWVSEHLTEAGLILEEVKAQNFYFYQSWQFSSKQFLLTFEQDEVEIVSCQCLPEQIGVEADEFDELSEPEQQGIGLRDFFELVDSALQFLHDVSN